MTDLSIIIVNYNTKNLLLNCLKSIYANKDKLSLQVIVVDNASTDGSQQMIKSEFPQANLIINKLNTLYTKANNQGLKKTTGKYSLILNSDTLITPSSLTTMYQFMERHPKCGMSSCREIDQSGITIRTCHKFHTPWTQILELPLFARISSQASVLKEHHYQNWNRRTVRQVDTIPGSFMFMRTKVVKQVNLLDEKLNLFYSDADLCKRVKDLGFNIMHNGRVSIKHFCAKSLTQFSLKYIKQFSYRDMIYYYQKHFGLTWSIIIRVIIKINLVCDKLLYFSQYILFTLNRILTCLKKYIDYWELIKEYPELKRINQIYPYFFSLLKPHYQEYISKVSHMEMTISLELAAFSLTFCQLLKPKKILDLGSGFSSFVFRYYQKNINPKAEVFSIDDDQKWLSKTKQYLKRHHLQTSNLNLWNQFKKTTQKFDLILHDLGNMEKRLETLPQVLKMVSKNSFIILDDMHFPDYSRPAFNMLKNKKVRTYSLRKYTKDKFGRYSCFVTAK